MAEPKKRKVGIVLKKVTRRRIYEAHAKRRAVEFLWPLDTASEPRPSHRYIVEGFDEETRLVVVARRRVTVKGELRWKVTAKLNHDPIRFLPGLPGTRNDDGDYQPEPEPVSRRYQELISAEGRLKTALRGAEQRTRAKVLAEEQRALDARRKGRKGTVRYIERVERHRELKDAA